MTGTATKTAARLTGMLACLVLTGALTTPRAMAGESGIVSAAAYHGHGGRHAAHVGYDHRPHHYRDYRYRRHHFGHGYYRHHHRHGVGRTLLGVGIGLLAYDIIHKSKARARARNAYYEEPSYSETYPARRMPTRSGSTIPSTGDCLQVREYQTTIVVGGEEREAYGDACLMPDGSWRLGPPKLVPAY